MRNFSDDEYLKIFRRMVYWEWYTDVNTKVLFLHCLIMANWRPGSWKGKPYKRGQFYTSLSSLAKETGLTIKQVRTALAHLKETGEVADSVSGKSRLITVLFYDKYQGDGQDQGQDNGTINGKVPARCGQDKGNRYKNNKNNKNKRNNTPGPPSPSAGVPDGSDGYGAPPPGWDQECEEQFLKDKPYNPRQTRLEWWQFWKE
jgi:hypothetical protein